MQWICYKILSFLRDLSEFVVIKAEVGDISEEFIIGDICIIFRKLKFLAGFNFLRFTIDLHDEGHRAEGYFVTGVDIGFLDVLAVYDSAVS